MAKTVFPSVSKQNGPGVIEKSEQQRKKRLVLPFTFFLFFLFYFFRQEPHFKLLVLILL